MKKLGKIIVFCIIIFFISTCSVNARAGGGSSSSTGSSSSGGSSSYHSHGSSSNRYNSNGFASLISNLLFVAIFIAGTSASVIVLRVQLSKSHKNSKKLMALLDDKDSSWKYGHILKEVEKAYYMIEQSWTNLDMTPAKTLMTEDLYEQFQLKLEWMQYRNQKNILKKIKLLEAIPISVYDDEDDSKDHVWFFIKGSMIDYTIDTTTNQIISGSNHKSTFIEYWCFMRNSEGIWVLGKILQEEEKDKIIFQ